MNCLERRCNATNLDLPPTFGGAAECVNARPDPVFLCVSALCFYGESNAMLTLISALLVSQKPLQNS